MKRALVVGVLVIALALAGCVSHGQSVSGSEPAPTSTPAPAPTVRPSNPEQSYRTGQIVGESLSNAWDDLKAFSKGVWSELNDNEEGENDG